MHTFESNMRLILSCPQNFTMNCRILTLRPFLEVLEVDILWPRWVARIGVTRSTQACFLAADRQCTELPLLRLPRLVHEFRGSDPMRQTRDLARVGWGEARCREGLCKKPIPVVRPVPRDWRALALTQVHHEEEFNVDTGDGSGPWAPHYRHWHQL